MKLSHWVQPAEADRVASLKARLPHLCRVVTPGPAVGEDRDGQPIPGPPVAVDGVACDFREENTLAGADGRELVDEGLGGVVIVRPTLIAPIDAPITHESRVEAIRRKRDGSPVAGGTYDVAAVVTRRYQREIVLGQVS